MSAIMKSMRFDYYRLAVTGTRGMVITILVPLVYAAIFGSAKDASAIIYPFVIIMTVMLSMNVFSSENMNGQRHVNGLIPVSRRSQVCGRYLFTVLLDCCGVAELLACNIIIGLLHGGMWSTDRLVYIAIWMCIGAAEQAILLPLLYKYEASKVLRVVTFAIFGVVLMIMVGTWWIPKEALMSAFQWFSTHASSSAPAVMLMTVAGSIVVLGVSLAASIRSYLDRDL